MEFLNEWEFFLDLKGHQINASRWKLLWNKKSNHQSRTSHSKRARFLCLFQASTQGKISVFYDEPLFKNLFYYIKLIPFARTELILSFNWIKNEFNIFLLCVLRLFSSTCAPWTLFKRTSYKKLGKLDTFISSTFKNIRLITNEKYWILIDKHSNAWFT